MRFFNKIEWFDTFGFYMYPSWASWGNKRFVFRNYSW